MDVLLIEDDLELASATSEMLRLFGHRVTLAHGVADALAELSCAHSFEAVLLDLRLGTERGETVVLRLKQLQLRYPPVILLSAQPDAELRAAAQEIGAIKALSKPASIVALTDALEQARMRG